MSQTKTQPQEIRLRGINASPGISIGKAYLVDKEGVDVIEQYWVEGKGVKREVKRFQTAVKKTRDELLRIIKDTPEDLRQNSSILEVHTSLLNDKMLYGQTISLIEKERVNAEWALKKTVSKIKTIFESMANPYLKERATDIVHLTDRIMMNLVGAESVNIGAIDKRVVLVAPDLSPAEASQIQVEKIKGIITDHGGRTSHTGIIARTLEIPAVLGLGNARQVICNDDIIVVDGSTGTVIVHPTEQTLLEYEERRHRYERYQADMTRQSWQPAQTRDGIQIGVMGNIELPEEVFAVINYGGDGIGLYRTEFQYLSQEGFPSEQALFDKYRDVIEVMAPKPVTIRTLDINGEKTAYGVEPNGVNPALGLRGIRYCLNEPGVFKTQLRAILRAAAYGNVRVMFPMVSGLAEVIEARRLVNLAAEELDKEGVDFNAGIKIGVLIEVPSAVIMADVLAENVDFFSIGTNDLIQYALAIDRGNRHVAHLFQPLEPVIIRLLHQTVTVAKDKGLNVSICGEMASDPLNTPIAMGLGLDELSMNPPSIPAVKRSVRELKADDTRLFMHDVLKKKTAAEILNLIREAYGDRLGVDFENRK